MDLKYLTTFKTVVAAGSFAKAAEKLGYTQSTITFQIGQLEQALGTRLFEKIGRRMALTQAGTRLLPYIDDVLASVDRMRYIENDLSECQGDLHIGIAETQLCYRMPALLKRFHQQAPKARLLLRSMNCYEIRDALLGGTLDLGVFYEDVGGFGASLTTYPLGDYPVALVASPDVKATFSDFITPDRHIPVSFIINEVNCIFRQMFEHYLREKAIRIDHTIELWSIPTIKNLVMSDVGISFLPRFAVQEELDRGALVEIPLEMPHNSITAVCSHHKNKWVSPLMQAFINLCAEEHDQ